MPDQQIHLEFAALLQDRKIQVEAILPTLLPAKESVPAKILEAMHYSLMAGGKRIRPVLCLLTHEIFGSWGPSVLRKACALEYLHTYTLIHDDLPCMDDDDLRRGVPTLHRAFSESIAVLAGDALLTEVFHILAEETENHPQRSLRVIRDLAFFAGTQGLISGQVLDLQYENQKVDDQILHEIHYNKTAKLIMASVRMGGILSGATEADLEALTCYGKAIGLAFQILDDILDATGDEEKLGKRAGQDVKLQKVTGPSVYGLDKSRLLLQERVEESISTLAVFGDRAPQLKQMAIYLGSRDR